MRLTPNMAAPVLLATTALVLLSSGHSAWSGSSRGIASSQRSAQSSDLGGQQAITKWRRKLASIAASNGLSLEELRSALLSDPSMRITATGEIKYIERPPSPDQTTVKSTAATAAAVSPSTQAIRLPTDIFKLNSYPGSNRTIYLDFTGADLTATNWNSPIKPSLQAAAFDLDGSPTTFNTAEKEFIYKVWQAVSEDYAPFDVNVTTQQPDSSQLNIGGRNDQRFGVSVVVTRAFASARINAGVGGTSNIGSFDNTNNTKRTVLVFYDTLGHSSAAPLDKKVAESSSHEVGHTLGLLHDGRTSPNVPYYYGQGTGATGWAPIMGAGFYAAVTQFDRGEFKNANNRQDDLSIIEQGGLSLRKDDAGDSIGSAASFPSTKGSPAVVSGTVSGVIGTSRDRDLYEIIADAGPLKISVNPAAVSANADLVITILDGEGKPVVTSNPPNSLSASIDYAVPRTGTYYLQVSSAGVGSPSVTGYSAYGSIGQYNLSASYIASTKKPPVAAFTASMVKGPAPLNVTVDAASSTRGSGRITSYKWDFGDGNADRTNRQKLPYVYNTGGKHVLRLTVTDDAGLSDSTNREISVDKQIVPAWTGKRIISGQRSVATLSLMVKDPSGAPVPGASVTATFSGGDARTLTSTTSASGHVSFTSYPSVGNCFRLTINAITRVDYYYAAPNSPMTDAICR
jgi:PKD repeat protein